LHSDETNAARFRPFPGATTALRCTFEVAPELVRLIDPADYARATVGDARSRLDAMLELFCKKIETLLGDRRPDVILVCLPDEEGDLVIANPRLSVQEREALRRLEAEDEAQLSLFAPNPDEQARLAALSPQADTLLHRYFYRALKARCMKMPNAVPLQVLRQHTYIDEKAQQSPGTRAWHLSVSLYYKSGHIPWRPTGLPKDTCFVGVSFHYLKRRSGDIIYASLAQAFSSDIEPFVLKGAAIPASQVRNRQPYLTHPQASMLARQVCDAYEAYAGALPTRIVVHKTSRYNHEESSGFRQGFGGVPYSDLVWLGPTGFRLIKAGQHAVWRGTLCSVGDHDHYLFTTGHVKSWKEYPGPHIPAPVQLGADGETDIVQRAREILELTKMNWNSSDALGRFPVTVSFAKKVGAIVTELDDDEEPNPSYRFYM